MKSAFDHGLLGPPSPGDRLREAAVLAAGLLLSAILLIGAGWVSARQERLQLDAFRTQAADVARIAESVIDGTLRPLDEALLVLRAAYVDHPGRFAETIALLRHGPLANPELLVVLVDRDGRLLFTDAPNAVPRTYVGDRRYFRFFADGGRDILYVDEPSLGRVTRRFTLPLARPVYDRRGGFLGVIAISLPQHNLVDVIPTFTLSGETTVVVVDHGGLVVNRSADPVREPGGTLPQPLLARLLEAPDGVLSSSDFPDGAERVVAFRHVHHMHTPLIIVVEASPAPLLRQTAKQRAALQAAAGFCSLAVMLLLASYLRSRRTTRRLIDSLRSGRKREYDTLTRSALDGFFIVDGAGRLLDVNDTFCAMTGHPREEALRLNLQEIEAAESPVDIKERIRTASAAGNDRFASRWRRKDGTVIDVEISTLYLGDGAGRFFCFVRDTTERNQAAESLRESEEKYRNLFQNAPFGIFHSLPEGRFLRVNPALAQMLRYATPEEMVAAITDISSQIYIDANVHSSLLSATLARTGWVFSENRYRRKDGTVLTANLNVRKALCPDGTLAYLEGFVEDITVRKQTEEALRRSEELLNETGRLARIGGWEIDLGTGALLWTRETFLIHEVEDAFVPTVEAAVNFYTPESRPAIQRAVDLAIGQAEPFDLELEIITARGNRRTVHVIGRADLKHRRIHGFFQDITERARLAQEKALLEDQLRQSQKVEAIGRLAGGVAHDFNNMTAIVLGYGELLLGQLGTESPSRKWAEQIVEAGRRSATLTRQLLAFSRRQVLLPVVLDLNGLLRNLQNMLGRLIGEDIALTFNLPGDLGRVTVDPGQIEQVVINLVINARDAMPRGGNLTIETANVELDEKYTREHAEIVAGDYVLLALTDTGCGMDKVHLARLFEPFFTTKGTGKGTGLGLATSYGIVKQSGGYIWAYSEPGRGTTFKIYLPRTDVQPAAVAVDHVGEAPRGSGERILVVEDEASLREMCEVILSQLGYRVSTAGNGPGAMALVAATGEEPDLVMTDVIMPCMSGPELAQRLRKDRPGLKVLYMSGYPDEAITSHGVLDPGIFFLQKPFSEHALARKVREVLGAGTAAPPPARRVLMIDDDEPFRELVRHFCAKHRHDFEGVGSAAAALVALAGRSFDVLLVDLNIPGTSGGQVLSELRAAGHAAPAIMLTGDVGSADLALLRPLGVVQVLEKCSSAEPLLLAIEKAVAPPPSRAPNP